MKYLALLALAAALPFRAVADTPADSAAVDSTKTFIFTDITLVPTTSVKDQNRSGTCWCFAGTSYFEDEIRRLKGDSLDLSEMYTVRKCYEDKADRYIRMYGQCNFSPGGSVTDVLHVWKNYGAVPDEVYAGLNYGEDKHDHSELHAAMSAYLKAVVAKPGKKLTTAWRQGLQGILDAYFGPLPETFEYKGKTYTPKSYAESLGLNMSDYVPVTSFTHHPFYVTFPVEVPDNWLWDQYYNVPLDELKEIIDNSLAKGMTVLWAADVSEPGFQWAKGVALMPKAKDENLEGTELARWVKLSDKDRAAERYDFDGPTEEIEVTQELRQQMFDNQETTDDHAMEIIGAAVDQDGNRYYKVKNSWDTNQIYDGFFYVSEPYVLAKTVTILVHRDVLPAPIAKKLKLK